MRFPAPLLCAGVGTSPEVSRCGSITGSYSSKCFWSGRGDTNPGSSHRQGSLAHPPTLTYFSLSKWNFSTLLPFLGKGARDGEKGVAEVQSLRGALGSISVLEGGSSWTCPAQPHISYHLLPSSGRSTWIHLDSIPGLSLIYGLSVPCLFRVSPQEQLWGSHCPASPVCPG